MKRFSSRKTDSDVAFELKVTNNGPGKVSKGEDVYYFYKTSDATQHTEGTYTLTHDVRKGEFFKIVIDGGWQREVDKCGASLKPF
jgi:hypothetical protein